MLNHLPIEIIDNITNHLNQKDLISISLVNKKCLIIAAPKLYHSIEINHVKNDLNHSTYTKITTLYNLKLFLKKLITDPLITKFIYNLNFKHLPDLPEDEMVSYFKIIFPKLINLNEFKWYSNYNLDISIVNLLPNELTRLNGNFKNFNNFNYDFKNLSSLSLSGFKNFNNIAIDLNKFKNLNFLKICKNKLIMVEDHLTNILINVEPLNLQSLCLENLFLTDYDVKLLLNKIDFSSITNLKILNCYQSLSNNNLLDNLRACNLSLNCLELNLFHNTNTNNNDNDNENSYIFDFLSSLQHLTNLKIQLNLSEKVQSNLINLISSLLPIQQSLNTLDINFTITNSNKFSTLNFNNYQVYFNLINQFSNLSVLKMPILSNHFNNLHLNLHQLSLLQLNLIDIHKFNNTLINNLDIDNDLNFSWFKTIHNSIESKPDFIIMKLNDYHIFNCNNFALNVSPILE